MESLNNGIVFKRNILLLKKNVPMYVCYKPIKLLLSFLFLCLCVNANLSVRIVRYPEHSHSQKLTTLTKFTLNHHQSPPPLTLPWASCRRGGKKNKAPLHYALPQAWAGAGESVGTLLPQQHILALSPAPSPRIFKLGCSFSKMYSMKKSEGFLNLLRVFFEEH